MGYRQWVKQINGIQKMGKTNQWDMVMGKTNQQDIQIMGKTNQWDIDNG